MRAHVLKMINYLYEAELNGEEINVGKQVCMILESLTPKFQQFKNNYVMNKMTFNLTQFEGTQLRFPLPNPRDPPNTPTDLRKHFF